MNVGSYARHQLRVVIKGSYRLDLSFNDCEAYKQMEFEQSFYLQEILSDLSVDTFGGTLVDQRAIDYRETSRWLSDCEEFHGIECHPATKFGFVSRPRTLLVVDVHKQCLVQLPRHSKYVAVSYVWGGAQLLHLNKDNIDDLLQPNSLARSPYVGGLPATIRDAIEVTREIGLQYIWIDSLCIQQDKPCETAYQVANMHNIFGSAFVAIVAAEGSSADSGLLGTSLRPRALRYGIELVDSELDRPIVRRIGTGLSLGLVSLNTCHHSNTLEVEEWNITKHDALPQHASIDDSLWNSRAWCFQEALLSSRALVFIDGQVFWHCSKSVWCESILGRKLGVSGRAIDTRYPRLQNLTSSPHFQRSWKQHDASIEVRRDGRSLVVSSEASLLYKHIVTSYTPRNIGRLDDRLAAFDGIGNVLEQCLNTSLLYGLPESLLDIALLWHGKTSITNVHKEIKAFPSWSWCGWKGAIKYPSQYGIERHEPRELYEHESPEERIRPLVRWYKTGEDGYFEPINDRGFGIRDALGTAESLPKDWEGVLAPSLDRNIDINVKSPSPQLLRCYTMKATVVIRAVTGYHLREEVAFDDPSPDLHSADKSFIDNYYRIYHPSNTNHTPIGELILDDATTSAARPGRHPGSWEIDLIALSETQFFRSHELNIESCENMYKRAFDYMLYNVMAVTWSADGQTAYRRGLGRVFQDDWHRLEVGFGWVNLG